MVIGTSRRQPVDKSSWRPCAGCGKSIPVVTVVRDGARGDPLTYMCPHCRYSHVGSPDTSPEARDQTHCLDCDTALGDASQCPGCNLPRAWMSVSCPTCDSRQPVAAPHFRRPCNLYRLECVACENLYISLCVC